MAVERPPVGLPAGRERRGLDKKEQPRLRLGAAVVVTSPVAWPRRKGCGDDLDEAAVTGGGQGGLGRRRGRARPWWCRPGSRAVPAGDRAPRSEPTGREASAAAPAVPGPHARLTAILAATPAIDAAVPTIAVLGFLGGPHHGPPAAQALSPPCPTGAGRRRPPRVRDLPRQRARRGSGQDSAAGGSPAPPFTAAEIGLLPSSSPHNRPPT